MSVGVFHTTYTYLNTILDGEQPLVVSSKHTVTNTVTAPDDYLLLLHPSETSSVLKDTNTYYSTIALEKTLYEGKKSSVISTNEVVTQVVITESVPPKATHVMTSYIALDVEDPESIAPSDLTTTDVVKTYFVTYTYYNTLMENGNTIIHTNVSTSSDVVTEKLFLQPKKTGSVKQTALVKDDKKKHKIDLSGENFHILATKSYQTTFTYFTTLLQEENTVSPTIISSRTKVVENIVTESIDSNQLDKKYISQINNEISKGASSIIRIVTLHDGQKVEITAIANEQKEKIKPTKVLPIEKTKLPELANKDSNIELEASTLNVIKGSTIVFFDDDPFAPKSTPVLESVVNSVTSVVVSSEVVKKTKIATATSKTKRATKSKVKNVTNTISPTKSVSSKIKSGSTKTKENNNKKQPTTNTKITKPQNQVSDLLGLGSINMNHLQALTPVLNAMAGLIQTNLKSNRRNDANQTTTDSVAKPSLKEETVVAPPPAIDVQNRSPIYIPVGGLADDFEIAESQNIATFHLQETIPDTPKDVIHGKLTHETALINGGIPISPGEVITANSDVIVGKPGRILPRVPAIPLNQVHEGVEVPIGMKPPPVPGKPWPKRNHEYKHIPVNNVHHEKQNGQGFININQNEYISDQPNKDEGQGFVNINQNDYFKVQGNKDDYVGPPPNPDFGNVQQLQEKPVIHAPNVDDYVGPPPPLKENHRDNKYKHIPLNPPRPQSDQVYAQNQFVNAPSNIGEHYNHGFNNLIYTGDADEIKGTELVYAQGQNNYGTDFGVNEVNHEIHIANLKETIQKNYDTAAKESYPVYAKGQASMILPSIPIGNDFNIAPSILNNPLVLPEVIERSTGQPLLVNLQPSQVAFVNIPYNRTTALIYGGSSEPHKNGEYFDDPSPYPEPEFQGVESFNQGLPQFASAYHDTPNPTQKQVNGVIKVGNQIITVDPTTSENQKVIQSINPSKTLLPNEVFPNNHEISVNVPPISFGMMKQGNDFNAHVINHGDMKFQIPAVQYEVTNNNHGTGNNPVQYEIARPNIQNVNNQHQGQSETLTNEQNVRPKFPSTQQDHNLHLLLHNEQNVQPPSNSHIQQNNVIRPKFPNVQQDVSLYNIQNNIVQQKRPPPRPTEEIADLRPPNEEITNLRPPNNPIPNKNKPKYPYPPKRNYNRPRPRPNVNPNVELSEFMTPPSPAPNTGITKRPQFGRPNTRPTPQLIPLIHDKQPQPQNGQTNVNQYYNIPMTVNQNIPVFSHMEDDVEEDEDDDSDLVNEDGEVIQESNSKPLRPGQVPDEILKTQIKTTTTPKVNIRFPEIRFPNHENEVDNYKSTVSIPRPFNKENHNQDVKFLTDHMVVSTTTSHNLIVRPENQQTNQISNIDFTKDVTARPVFNREVLDVSTVSFDNLTATHETKHHSTFKDHKDLNIVVVPHIHQNGGSNKNDLMSVLSKERVPVITEAVTHSYETYTEKTTMKILTTRTPKPITRPVIEENKSTTNKPQIYRLPTRNSRPKITSLPIDTKTTLHNVWNIPHNTHSQTEKPFAGQPKPSRPTNEINIKLDVPTIPTVTKENSSLDIELPVSHDLNTGEVTIPYSNITTEMSDMEILKPPPLRPEITVNPPDTKLHPPKIEINTSGGINRVPSLNTEHTYDLESQSTSSPQPYVPEPSEEMVPPPKIVSDEEVVGMSPPPLVSTHKPRINLKPVITTENTIFPIDLDLSNVPVVYQSTSTEDYTSLKTRRPYKRPPFRKTTTPPTEFTTQRKRPSYPSFNFTGRNRTSLLKVNETTTSINILPSPTIQTKPSLEVIIGNPDLDIDDSETSSIATKIDVTSNKPVELSGSEEAILDSAIESTSVLPDKPTMIFIDGTKTKTHYSNFGSEFSTAVHHAGNEIKIVDDPTTTKKVLPTIKDTKVVLPTRYITHTKTSTVTITKTTVVKTLGGPPSTLTILVTKTEKSTIVDTVTEFHTLVKPTSIVETITTTIQNHVSSLYPPEVYGSQYPSIQVKPTTVNPEAVIPTTLFEDLSDDDLEDFIISETDSPIVEEIDEPPQQDNESIFVVMTDKNKGSVIKVPNGSYETQERDEMISNNEVNNVLLAGILTANHPTPEGPRIPSAIHNEKCEPECKASRNELCQKVEGVMRCICRPGFARMFPDRPCNRKWNNFCLI